MRYSGTKVGRVLAYTGESIGHVPWVYYRILDSNTIGNDLGYFGVLVIL